MAMSFSLPESGNAANICRYYLDTIDDSDIYGRTFPLPTLDDLLSYCREQYAGDWEFDIEAERSFSIVAFDEYNNYSVAGDSQLILNPSIDWSLYPSIIYLPDSNFPLWSTTYYISKDETEAAPYFDFELIKHVSFGVPVSYLDPSSAQVNKMCYFQIPDQIIGVNSNNELNLSLMDFDSLAFEGLPGCSSDIPEYQHGMLGETQTAVSVYLWTQETITDFSEIEKAFEVLQININLPPEIVGHTLIRMSTIEMDTNTVQSGDIIHFNIANSQNIKDMFLRLSVPEAFSEGDTPSIENTCSMEIYADADGVFGQSFRVPSASEFSTHCHQQYDGGWTFDVTISRNISIRVYDDEDNRIPYELTLAAQIQTPGPDPTAPPNTELTPPKKIIPAEPTPPTPTPELPNPILVSAPPAPSPGVDSVVIPSEPVVAVSAVPVAVIESTDVSVKSELASVKKPLKKALVAKACIKAGVWIFTKNNLLQICDTKLKPVLVIPACTGKKATPTYPWLFKAQRFKPGYSSSQSGQKLYYSVFFFKGLAIAGVNKVSPAPCSNGSVFIEKKYAKQVYTYIAKNKSLIWVKS
jgi:hypothetical protein